MWWFIVLAIYILVIVRYLAKIKSAPDSVKEEAKIGKEKEQDAPARQREFVLANRRGEKYRLVETDEGGKTRYRVYHLQKREERLVREFRDKSFQEARDTIIFSG